jgi:uncharacterized protein (TIGR02466 family)
MDEPRFIQNHFLFPTTVGSASIGRKLSNVEMNFIKGLEYQKNTGNDVSVDSYVLNNNELKKLKQFCEDSINQYFLENYAPKQPLSLKITQSWVNCTSLNQYHHHHFHSNSAFSGVFYIDTIDELDQITFYNPHTSQIKFDVERFNQSNSTNWWLPCHTGSLLMFPSHLAHSVESKEHGGLRVSLSFNTYWVGTLGNSNERTELKL